MFIDKIKALSESNSDVVVVWLYGSQAKGKAVDSSDYDLAIAFNSVLKDAVKSRLRPELLAIDWAKALKVNDAKISIVDISLIPIPLAWEVLQANTILFCKNQDRKVKEELRIASMYELNVLHHRKLYGN